MSAADRRQVQETLRRLDYYHGPLDGIFGGGRGRRSAASSVIDRDNGHVDRGQAVWALLGGAILGD
jgi:hypothetical protein